MDLNVAARLALQEAVDFLQTEKGMTAADAYALSSLAVDLGIGEAMQGFPKMYFAPMRPIGSRPCYKLAADYHTVSVHRTLGEGESWISHR